MEDGVFMQNGPQYGRTDNVERWRRVADAPFVSSQTSEVCRELSNEESELSWSVL